MEKKRIVVKENRSIKKAILFCLVVFSLIIASIILRVVNLVKSSTYDGASQFSVGIRSEENNIAKIISINPKQSTVSVLTVTNVPKSIEVGTIVGIPLQGKITVASSINKEEVDPANIFLSVLGNPKGHTKNINEIDLLRLFFSIKTVSSKDYTYDEITLPMSSSAIDDIAIKFFLDTRLVEDNKSIEIVNGTGVSGLGKRLERIIKNNGGNVIAISNSQKTKDKTTVLFFKESSYTQKKFAHFLKATSEQVVNRSIADITIVIGKDNAHNKNF